MIRNLLRSLGGACVALIICSPATFAQRGAAPLPATRADTLLQAGRWAEAEDLLYAAARADSRDPVARAALGRYLAMKGAILPGMTLISEAEKFGLDAATTNAMLAPWRAVQRWRGVLHVAHDSAVVVEPTTDTTVLFRLPLPGADTRGAHSPQQWLNVVPRIIGIDSVSRPARFGAEVVEQLVPSYDLDFHELTLHADPRSALRAIGQRYRVLRSPTEINVLVGPGRVLPLTAALRELDAHWWQLDLPHGLLVVR